ncbi:MAG: fibrobacter succinogenes major paralogous domain-containing protein, partial [Bacteroidales bacterium]|nr:fibrobacter succinogenes major paralogous domain-containing protein [Bacteroidales bacterium]
QVTDLRVDSLRLKYSSRGTGKPTTEMVGSALESSLSANWNYSAGLYPMPAGIPETNRTIAARIPIYFAQDESSASIMSDFTLPTSILGHNVSWVSSNPNVISISGGRATVTRPGWGEPDEEVTLTATYEGVTKTFVVLVISPKIVPVNTDYVNVESDSISIYGSFNPYASGISYIKEYGFLYSSKPNFSDSTKVVSTNLSEDYDEEVSSGMYFSYETATEDFEPGKFYYTTAFATTADTTMYGEVKRFRTTGPPDAVILCPEYRDTTSMRRIIVDIESDDEDGLELTMYWGTDRNNLTEQTYIYYESDWGNYYADIYDLQPETKYWLVAEATDSYGTSRSDTVAFYTYGSFIDDRDDTEYKSIIIGNQKWMAENLRYAGNIPLQTSETSIGSETEPYRYYPNGEENNVETYGYGYLYNWAAAMNTATDSSSVMNPSGVQGICPNGWHLPSEAEWQELHNELGTGIFDDAGSQMAGGYWESGKLKHSYGFGTSGFNALPAGGFFGTSDDFGEETSFWSTTETNFLTTDGMVNAVANCSIEYSSTNSNKYWSLKEVGSSVRCIRGTTVYAAYDTVVICADHYTYLDTTFTESGDYLRRFFYEEFADTAYSLHLNIDDCYRMASGVVT